MEGFKSVTVGDGTPLKQIVEIPLPAGEKIFSDKTQASIDHQKLSIVEDAAQCEHVWKKGMLPGNKFIKTCKLCGETVPVTDHALWQTLPN